MEKIDLCKVRFVFDDRINVRVVNILSELIEELATVCSPKSIILSGSFGKGEATVVEQNGNLKFLSDCEIILIPPNHIFNRKQTKDISDKMWNQYGLAIDLSGVSHSKDLLFPYMSKRMKPTMANYDLKFGSKTVYGNDYLKRIPNFSQEDIPCWEGIRLLLNRMVESTNYFSVKDQNAEMIFWTDKIILSCQDALLIHLGRYNKSYNDRNTIFNEAFRRDLNELYSDIPSLLNMAYDATKRKILGRCDISDPFNYWFDAAEIMDKVFRYLIKTEYGFEFDNYLEFQEFYLQSLDPSIHDRLLYEIKKNLKVILIYGDIKYINFVKPWNQVIYSLIPLLYFNLSRNLAVNLQYIYRIRSLISPITSLDGSISHEDYNYKSQFIQLWKIFC